MDLERFLDCRADEDSARPESAIFVLGLCKTHQSGSAWAYRTELSPKLPEVPTRELGHPTRFLEFDSDTSCPLL